MEDLNDDLETESEVEIHFLTKFGGTIDTIQLEACSQGQSVVIRYEIVAGAGWTLLNGQQGALSQTAEVEYGDVIVVNFPIDVAYRSNTPFGWPQLVLSVYGMNSWGMETIIGYGRTHFPTTHGVRQVKVPLFAPRPDTPFGNFMSWITGKTPELINPIVISEGNDNYLLRTKSYGHVNISLNLISKGLKDLGYDNISGVS